MSGQQTTLLIDDIPDGRQSITDTLAAPRYNWTVTFSASLEQAKDIAPAPTSWHVHARQSEATNVVWETDGPRMRFDEVSRVAIRDLDGSRSRLETLRGVTAVCRQGFAPT